MVRRVVFRTVKEERREEKVAKGVTMGFARTSKEGVANGGIGATLRMCYLRRNRFSQLPFFQLLSTLRMDR